MATEDLTGAKWTLTDPGGGGTLTRTTTRATASGITSTEDAQLRGDYGAGYFDALTLDFDFQISSSSGTGCLSGASLSISDAGIFDSGVDANDLLFTLNREVAGYRVYILRGWFAETDATGYVLSAGTTYYTRIKRAAGNATVQWQISSSSANRDAETPDIDTLAVTLPTASTKYRYLFAWRNYSGDGTSDYNHTENFNLNEAAPASSVAVFDHHYRMMRSA